MILTKSGTCYSFASMKIIWDLKCMFYINFAYRSFQINPTTLGTLLDCILAKIKFVVYYRSRSSEDVGFVSVGWLNSRNGNIQMVVKH